MVTRRLVAVLLAALVALFAQAGAAAAQPAPVPSPAPTGRPGVLQSPQEQANQNDAIRREKATQRALQQARAGCKRPPSPASPREGMAGRVDSGPSAPTGSDYSRLGWGGLGLVIYDPGCSPAKTWAPRVQDGPNAVAAGLLWLATVLSAATILLARIVTDPSGWLGVILQPVLDTIGVTVAPAVFTVLYFLLAAVAATMLVASARKKGALPGVARASGGMLAILVVAAACIGWSQAAARSTDGMTAMVFPAVGKAVAGGTPVDVALGDMLTDGVIVPLWTMAQLGDDSPAAITAGKALREASTFTREEQARIDADPAQRAPLTAAKLTAYVAAAKSWQDTQPASYEQGLAGNDTGYRVQWAALALLGTLLTAGPLLAALAAWTVFAVFLEVVPRVFPIFAGFLQLPRWQRHAAAAARWGGKWAGIGVGGIVVFLAWGSIVGAVIGNPALSIWQRLGGLTVLAVVVAVAWRLRSKITERLRITREVDIARRGADGVRERFGRRHSRDRDDAAVTGAAATDETVEPLRDRTSTEPVPAPSREKWDQAREVLAASRERQRRRNPKPHHETATAFDDRRRDFDLTDVYEAQEPTNPALLKLRLMEDDELARRAAAARTTTPTKQASPMPDSTDVEPVTVGAPRQAVKV